MRKSIIILAGTLVAILLVSYLRPYRAPHELSGSASGTSRAPSSALPSSESDSPSTGDPMESGPRRSPRHESGELSKDRLPTIERAIAEQEVVIEEKRKALTAIVRERGIIYKGNEGSSTSEQSAPQPPVPSQAQPDVQAETKARGLSAEAYVDAKRDFEKERSALEVLKLKLAQEKARQAVPSR